MKRLLPYCLVIFLFLVFGSTPFHATAQKDNDVLRIENGMMIVRFDRKDIDECRQLLLYFGLKEDSLFTYQNIGSLAKDGWKISHVDKNMAEITKPVDKGTAINGGMPIYLKQKVPNGGSPGYPGPVTYGVNSYKASPTVYENKNDETVFVLRGNLKATKVFLSGNFNDWSTVATPMMRTDSGWVSLQKLKPGKYLYKFIVDGHWIFDMGNSKRENDGHGGFNSIYFHYNYIFKLAGYTSAKKVVLTGSFNNWNEKELQMQPTGNGWKLPMYLNEGTYSYKFIVDNDWILDPASKVTRPDGTGNFNSFMSLGDTVYFRLDGYTSANLVILSGSFNEWNTAELSMTRTKTGWQIPYVLAAGNYEYKFIVDGKWIADPINPLRVGETDHVNSIRIIKPNYTFVMKRFPDAKQVLLSGSFNGWAEPGYTMVKKDGTWIFPIYLAAGKYTYKFVVDGKWITDPDNKLYEENEFGTGNSVLWMEPAVTDFDR